VLEVEARLQWAEEGMGREEVEVVSLSSGGKAIGWQPDGEGIRSWCRGCEERRRTLEHRELRLFYFLFLFFAFFKGHT